jgi:hypothetical protein
MTANSGLAFATTGLVRPVVKQKKAMSKKKIICLRQYIKNFQIIRYCL